MLLSGNAHKKHLVLLAGTGPAGKGVNEFCWLWEAGSSLLSWSRKVTGGGGGSQRQRETSLVCGLLVTPDLAIWMQNWDGWVGDEWDWSHTGKQIPCHPWPAFGLHV